MATETLRPGQEFKVGQKVWFLTNPHRGGGPQLEWGVVKRFEPALKGTALVTKGKPFYSVQTHSKGSTELPDAHHVEYYSDAGKKRLLRKLAAHYRSLQAFHLNAASECRGMADDYENQAKAIRVIKRGRA